MRKLALLLALVAATTLLTAGVAFTQVPENGGSDHYIVVLEDDVDNPSQVAGGIEQRQNLEVGFVYGHALKGFSATIPDERLDDVRADPKVAYVERDGMMHAVDQVLPWGIDRIDADLSSTVAGNGSGEISNVNVYVIDSGVDASHADLNVVHHVNIRRDGKNYDCNGHGTHVAGTVAAKDDAQYVVGVAPGAPLTAVKVLGCGGGGPTSAGIKGVDWVTANASKPANASKSAIANMSIAAPASQALDEAVRRSKNSGVFYSVAAGNEGRNACNYSPARAGAGTNNGIVTTAATNKSDAEPPWSNYGRCVDIWAPGTKILSTKSGGGTMTISGTSMASPHVGGTGALYLSNPPTDPVTRVLLDKPVDVEKALKAASVHTDTTSKNGREIRLVNADPY